jgi:enoyl-CoA hydratase/carnithine racemase
MTIPLSDWRDIDLDAPLDGLRYEKDGAIAVITLDRPDRGNAIHSASQASIFRAIWEDVREDDAVRAAIVTGAGDRHFCTGVDLIRVSEHGPATFNRPLSEVVVFTARQARVWKPMIAAVNGTAAGAGLHFVVDADIVVASENASFLDAHVNAGLVGGIENIGLAKRLPLGTALRMSLQGKDFRISAERAFDLGLVDELTPKGAALDVAKKIAASIAANSPQATTLTQQAIWASLEMPYQQAQENAWALIRTHWSHPDASEGARAFVEKRAPRWNPDPDAKRECSD